jgi:hypothetical protein
MNPNLPDPKLMVLAVAVILVIIRWNANVFRNSGSPYRLVLSIPPRGQSQKPMTWCPL